MTRHISDNQPTPDSSKSAGILITQEKLDLKRQTRRKLLEHEHQASARRLAQFLKIERGHKA